MTKKSLPKEDKQALLAEMLTRGLAVDEKAAKGLILSGDVIVNDQMIDKVGHKVSKSDSIRVRNAGRFVSRGGDKLYGAITDFLLEEAFKDKSILDIGASTGGFTDCCLQLGAKKVFAVDVGTNQLAWKLRQDPRVLSFEKTDIRDFQLPVNESVDWIVADISFNSLANVVADMSRLAPFAKVLLLVKPQFELPKELIPKGGVVSEDSDRELAAEMVVKTLENNQFKVLGKKNAHLSGRSGNLEIFIYAQRVN